MKKRKMILHGPFLPAANENRMNSVGDTEQARERFLIKKFNNLDYLLKERYLWMNQFFNEGENVIEIGSGAGFSEFYLKQRPLMTDVVKSDWIDKILDGTKMNLSEKSVDVIICSHAIHHFYSPYKFFRECERVLRPGGRVLIYEAHTSLLFRVLLKLMRHEGWSYDVDVFDPDAIINDPDDPWSANCAIAELFFDEPERFEKNFSLKIDLDQKKEGFIFPLSGGVIAKTPVPELPTLILNLFFYLDSVLIALFPNVFALGRVIVLRKPVDQNSD